MFLCYKRWLLRSIRLLWKMETKIFVMLLLRLSPCRIWKIFYLRQTEQVFSTIWRGSWSIVAAIAFPRRQKTNVNKVCFPTFFIKNLNINISWGDTSATHPQPQSVKKYFNNSFLFLRKKYILILYEIFKIIYNFLSLFLLEK